MSFFKTVRQRWVSLTTPSEIEQELAWRGYVVNNLAASLLGLAVVFVIMTGTLWLLGLDDGASVLAALGSSILYIAIYQISQRWSISAAIFVISIYAIGISSFLSFGWGIADIAVSGIYAGSIVMTSLLLRGRAFLLLVGILLISYFAISTAELNGWFTPPFYTELRANQIVVTLFLLYLGILGYLTATVIDRVIKAQGTETARRQELESRTRIATEIQLSMLPAKAPQHPRFEIEGASMPARDVGGDFYNYYELDDNLVFLLGDVTGKGMPAALLMAVTMGVIDGLLPSTRKPNDLLEIVSTRITHHCNRARLNVACMALFVEHDQLRMANAGCIQPLIRRKDGTVAWIKAEGLPLGIEGYSKDYDQHEARFDTDDFIILMSDGVVEAQNLDGEMLGFARAEQVVIDGPLHSAEAMLDYIVKQVGLHQGSAEQADDVTIVVIRVK